MSGAWLASYIALWAVVAFQGAIIFVLLRQLGLIYMGTAQGVARDGIAVGERAAPFSQTDLEGRTVTLEGYLGKPLLLIFGSPSCAPCRNLIPDLNVFAQERAHELQVLFLSRGEPDATREFASEAAIGVPIASHPDEKLPDAYKARVTPFGFLIDGEGIVRAKGLTNHRDHLDMLVRMAGDKALRATDVSRNGASEGEPAPVEKRT